MKLWRFEERVPFRKGAAVRSVTTYAAIGTTVEEARARIDAIYRLDPTASITAYEDTDGAVATTSFRERRKDVTR